MDRGLSVFRVLICTQEREQYIKEEKREMKRNHKEEIDCGVLMDGLELSRNCFTGRRRSGRGEEEPQASLSRNLGF